MENKINIQLEALFLEHYKEWCLLAYSYLGSSVEAEEVVQDVCVKVLLKGKSNSISNLEGYIFIAVKNGCLKRLKRKKRFETLTETNVIIAPSIEENLIVSERKHHIQQALESLPEQCKVIFQLCVLEGQKYQMVADSMGLSINTVKYHVKNAYRILRLQAAEVYSFLGFLCMLF